VHLLGSTEALLRAEGTPFGHEAYGSTRDLLDRLRAHVVAAPSSGIVHSAAVGDYEALPSAGKIPSGQATLSLTLQPTPKILDAIRGWGLTGPLVSFKAASPETTDEALVAIARAQLRRTGSDRVFANVIGRTGANVFLVDEADAIRFEARAAAIAALQDWLYARLA
jgi:phosphopantothenoylcysteine decarboxylase/phosphopantothenate--cysteine ligase